MKFYSSTIGLMILLGIIHGITASYPGRPPHVYTLAGLVSLAIILSGSCILAKHSRDRSQLICGLVVTAIVGICVITDGLAFLQVSVRLLAAAVPGTNPLWTSGELPAMWQLTVSLYVVLVVAVLGGVCISREGILLIIGVCAFIATITSMATYNLRFVDHAVGFFLFANG